MQLLQRKRKHEQIPDLILAPPLTLCHSCHSTSSHPPAVQEYCDGGSLAQALHARRFHSKDILFRTLCVALNVAAGMKYLHDKQIIHGEGCRFAMGFSGVLCMLHSLRSAAHGVVGGSVLRGACMSLSCSRSQGVLAQQERWSHWGVVTCTCLRLPRMHAFVKQRRHALATGPGAAAGDLKPDNVLLMNRPDLPHGCLAKVFVNKPV